MRVGSDQILFVMFIMFFIYSSLLCLSTHVLYVCNSKSNLQGGSEVNFITLRDEPSFRNSTHWFAAVI